MRLIFWWDIAIKMHFIPIWHIINEMFFAKNCGKYILCVGCRLGTSRPSSVDSTYFSGWPNPSKKNESERRPAKKNSTATVDRQQTRIECRTNSKFSKSVVYVIWNWVREFWSPGCRTSSNSAGCYNEQLFPIFYSDDSNEEKSPIVITVEKNGAIGVKRMYAGEINNASAGEL